MVILKVNADTNSEREIEIVSDRGLWRSGIYKVYNAHYLSKTLPETHEHADKNNPDFLGDFNVDKEKADWAYNGDQLTADEQNEIAQFILDYQAPDAVY